MITYFLYLKKPVRRDGINTNVKAKVNRWFDSDCYRAKQDFKVARNAFIRNKTDANRNVFTKCRTKYNRLKYKAKRAYKIREGKRLSSLARNQPRYFWKELNKYSKNNKSLDTQNIDIEDLFTHFRDLLQTNDETYPTQQTYHNQNVDQELDAEFTVNEIKNAVFHQKNNKASGPDEICAEILKTSFDYICPFLLKLYNRIFNRAEYPRDWGTSIITPIYKGGNKNIASNYRGITLTNILAKIYSQILSNRLNSWTDRHEKISNCQFGFQKGKSTVDCIFIFHSIVYKMLNSGKKVYAAFLDYEKCFDKINRLFLFQKLIAQNVSCKMINAIKAMYSTVRSYIRCNNETSDFIRSDTGVKQGDPSSPLLAMMFMNDIINYINSDIEGIVTINELKLFILLYADDQVIISTSAISLQSMINDVQNYCDMWGLKINPGKSKIMIFEKGNKATHYTFYLYGN